MFSHLPTWYCFLNLLIDDGFGFLFLCKNPCNFVFPSIFGSMLLETIGQECYKFLHCHVVIFKFNKLGIFYKKCTNLHFENPRVNKIRITWHSPSLSILQLLLKIDKKLLFSTLLYQSFNTNICSNKNHSISLQLWH
jgi:hypothetical protein